MVMLVLLVMGASAILISSLNSRTLQVERNQKSAEALAQAKEALIGYAITYSDSNTNPHGFLPCPDQGQNSSQDGETNGSCGVKNVSAIGKLPWKTLGLSTLKDGNGECLWYAVSGTYKYNPDTDFMNWDNTGLFKIMATDGTSFVAGSSADNQPIAVIFSPGTPLGTQSRSSATNTPSCGGNYTTSNYLDNNTVHNINNAIVSSTAQAVTQFVIGSIKDASNNVIVNDQMNFISKKDIFNAIKKRNDFGSNINYIMTHVVTCLSSLPKPKTINFSNNPITEATAINVGNSSTTQLRTGRIDKDDCTGSTKNLVHKWRDNLAYAECIGSCILSVNGSSCKGVVIFSGERNTSQNRTSNTEKNTWSNYLEGDALDIFTSGAKSVTGVPITYNPDLPSTDLWACIP